MSTNCTSEKTDAPAVVHLQVTASSVKCGAKMAPYAGAPGWTLSEITVDAMKVTCLDCAGPRARTRLEAAQRVANVDSGVLLDIADGWRTAGEPAALVAAARRELVRRHPCVDCGAAAGSMCKPDYGCEWASRRYHRFIVRETVQGSYAVRDTETGTDFRTCTGTSRFITRGSARACADNLNRVPRGVGRTDGYGGHLMEGGE